jgi:Ca-activated chloride channel family protein
MNLVSVYALGLLNKILMEQIRFAYPIILLISVPLVLAAILYRLRWHQPISYAYPLAAFLSAAQKSRIPLQYIFIFLRLCVLLILAFLLAKPQLVDTSSQVHGQGIDIMLVLDISGSMQCFDDQNDRRQRIDIAKDEAVRFVDKRDGDQIGLVLFGREAVSRLPLTLDKKMLKQTIEQVKLGDIDANGTVLSKGMTIACARLKSAPGKSKVMIVLTDGEPTAEDSSPQIPVDIAKKLGIKIYTIGIGDEKTGGLLMHPIFGVVVPAGARLNKKLLEAIAHETGGQFFEAKKPEELRAIYDQINALEKTEYETTIFSNYHDLFIPFIWVVIVLLSLELILSSFVWSVL